MAREISHTGAGFRYVLLLRQGGVADARSENDGLQISPLIPFARCLRPLPAVGRVTSDMQRGVRSTAESGKMLLAERYFVCHFRASPDNRRVPRGCGEIINAITGDHSK